MTAFEDVTGWSRLVPDFNYLVSGLLPPNYSAYLRILHPFEAAAGDEPVTWAQVAQWSGRSLHRLAQWPVIAEPTAVASGPSPISGGDPYSCLTGSQISSLVPYLKDATSTPDTCYFAVWSGFGEFREIPSPGHETGLTQGSPDTIAAPFETIEPHLALPGRDYVIFRGPLSHATQFSQALADGRGGDFTLTGVPNVWWPLDRAWMINSDIDLQSTYIGGSASLINAIIGEATLETFPAALSDNVSVDSDTLNRP